MASESRIAQGLPPVVEDDDAYRALARIVLDARKRREAEQAVETQKAAS